MTDADVSLSSSLYGTRFDSDRFMLTVCSALLCPACAATDADFERVQGVIAHEYFHNWTGNRVTCRDWFQLTLKEGLTVFRDQQVRVPWTPPRTVHVPFISPSAQDRCERNHCQNRVEGRAA